ncbi:MAG: hypothetical protein FWF54_02170, partial [Candidatus Azobacteroides sp.]|nr:hypothetical protein [Candidatus Azobacteroides sp.]
GLLYPELRLPACKGLSIFKTYGLVFRLTRRSGYIVRHGGIKQVNNVIFEPVRAWILVEKNKAFKPYCPVRDDILVYVVPAGTQSEEAGCFFYQYPIPAALITNHKQ